MGKKEKQTNPDSEYGELTMPRYLRGLTLFS